MSVIITGSTGFIGKHLTNYLSQKLPKLKIYALYNKGIPFSDKKKLKFIKYSLGKKFNFKLINKESTIIHLAWDHIPDYKTTKHITTHLKLQKHFIKNVIKKKPKSLFVMGTCFEYQNSNRQLDENSKIKPQNNYALGKNKLRIYIKKNKYKSTNFTWGRLFYVYGKNQPKHTLYGQFLRNKKNKIRLQNLVKNKNLELDYLNIRTVCKYIYKLSFNNKNNNEVNVCSGKKTLLQNMLLRWLNEKQIKIKRNTKCFYGSNNKLKSLIDNIK